MINKLLFLSLIARVSFVFAATGTQAEWAAALERAVRHIDSDDLGDDNESLTPPPNEQVQNRYGLSDAEMRQMILPMAERFGADETNECNRAIRVQTIYWLGSYGTTNDIPFVTAILTNRSDFAVEAALGASMCIRMRTGGLTNLVDWVVSSTNVFDNSLRRLAYIWLYDMGKGHTTFPVEQATKESISAFFLSRAGVERTDSILFVDRAAYELNPSYRHSQQRRDNLAALRPPGLTGRRAELYDAAQADAAQGD